METPLCPYPGLRPFDEKEAIFFKGREKNIGEVIKQLEQRRFVMITGASGDGKSSIVYAGVIPDIKAGFIKATYNTWKFSIIKPENRPLYNLSKSLADIFELPQPSIHEELSFGFSSIVELYKQSKYYIDTNQSEWLNLTLEGKRERRAKAANLLILVDQFEEFFTSSENIINGEPSIEAETTINLLVETVRIANEEGLPIYIVFTMRSDFIGNTPTFRGLPELIGFSHFFIPRLNREELEKIILQPALLNGNAISEKLVNYLSSAANEGTDQLPIIQHTLNRIWNIAKIKDEEMNIVHLAMAGGIVQEELSEEEKNEFRKYLSTLPKSKQEYFINPSLQNVINAHADELMTESIDAILKKQKSNLNKEELQFAIKRIFQTLTKIDNGRAVRHRASVTELANNIGNNKVGLQGVASLISKFRQPNNSLITPFSSNQQKLTPETTIDITHEALIRNWSRLNQWSAEDERNYTTFRNFDKQLDSWNTNNRSTIFLLPLGPLELFEEWRKTSFINESWIVKYDESSDVPDIKHQKAKEKISDIDLFLTKSREHINDIEAKKKIRNRIILYVSILIVFILSGITVWAFFQKNNASAQQKLAEQKRIEAEALKSQALKSKTEAERAKTKAEENEQAALKAKLESEEFAKEAIEQRNIAEKAVALAQSKTILANKEAKRANLEAENANKQKLIAEDATKNAVASEEKTKVLSLKALSQQVAYMATEKYEDIELAPLFAMHAFDLHKEVNGETLDPVIYNGLIQASNTLFGKDYSNFNQRSDVEQIIISSLNTQMLFSVGLNGTVYTLNKEGKKIEKQESLVAKTGNIQNLFYEPAKKLLYIESASGKINVYGISETEKKSMFQFSGFDKNLRGAQFFSTQQSFVLISQEGKIYLYTNNPQKPEQTLSINESVLSFTPLNDSTSLIGTSKNNIYAYSPKVGLQKVFSGTSNRQTPYCIESLNNGAIIFAGFSDGRVMRFSWEDYTLVKHNEYKLSKTLIKKLSFNLQSKLLAAVSTDNKIWLIDLNNKNSKPAYVSFNSAVKSVFVDNQGDLYATLADQSIKQFFSDSNKLYSNLCNSIKRDLTKEEWNEKVSAETEFHPLKCKK